MLHGAQHLAEDADSIDAEAGALTPVGSTTMSTYSSDTRASLLSAVSSRRRVTSGGIADTEGGLLLQLGDAAATCMGARSIRTFEVACLQRSGLQASSYMAAGMAAIASFHDMGSWINTAVCFAEQPEICSCACTAATAAPLATHLARWRCRQAACPRQPWEEVAARSQTSGCSGVERRLNLLARASHRAILGVVP